MLSMSDVSSTPTLQGPDPRLRRAAQEFESMLLQDLMKFGSEDDDGGGELDQGCQSYEDLRNQAVATTMAQNGGIGIANMLVKQLSRNEGH